MVDADADIVPGVIPPAEPMRAIYFDGQTNQKHMVTLKPSAALEISEAGVFLAAWAYGDIRRADGPQAIMRLRDIAAAPLARLEIRDLAAQAEIARLCTLLDGEGSPGDGSVGRIIFWSCAAAASIFAVIWFAIPFLADRLAPLVPVAVEKRLGDASNRQVRALFGDKTCTAPEGTRALQKLVDQLQAQARLRIAPVSAVLNSAIPNAFALPGGRVYVLSKLIQRAESPDELAGTLAHEFGHIAHRDGLRRLIADGSTSFLFGLLLGDVTGGGVVLTAGRSLFSAAYSRESEAAADLYSRDLMQKLGRSPKAFGMLLLRLTGSEKDNPLAIFASHPMSEDRMAALSQAGDVPEGPPLLSNAEWQALKAICK
jgi:Zn-dependent protease with chaperone function